MVKKYKTKKDFKKGEIVLTDDLEPFVWDEEILVDALCDYVDLCYIDEVLEIIYDYNKSKIKEALKNK